MFQPSSACVALVEARDCDCPVITHASPPALANAQLVPERHPSVLSLPIKRTHFSEGPFKVGGKHNRTMGSQLVVYV